MSKIHHGYEELTSEQIDDPDGARAVFSKRVSMPPLYTVAFFKTYRDANDNASQTSFFTRRTLASLRRVVDRAEARLSELEADAEKAREAEPTKSVGRR